MAFDNKGWPVFPTRQGSSVGKAIENKMLGAVGGADTICTRIQTLPDGSTVRLRTRNGMPEFVRTQTPPDAEEQKLFLDNGFVTPGAFSASATSGAAAHVSIAASSDTISTYGEAG